jgi:protein O-mannosyl-transferase
MHSYKETLIAFGAYLLLALVVYGGVIAFGYSIIDDQLLVSRNMFIQGPTLRNLAHAFSTYDPELYIPFTLVSYQINYAIGGLEPWIYHLTDILLHSGSALLVTCIARRFVFSEVLAYAAGLVFLLHPINTEAIVWISGRKDILSTFFALLSIVYFLKSRDGSWASLSLLFFLFALLSKASVMTLPLIFALLMLTDTRSVPDTVRRLSPFILLSTVFAVIAIFGKQRIVESSGFVETLLMAGKSVIFYLQKLFVPTGLNPFYPYHDPITITSPDFAIPLLIIIAITVFSIISLRFTKWVLLTWVIFLILLSPSFLNAHKGITWFFAVDRYVYFPSIVLIIGYVCLIEYAMRRMWRQKALIVGVVLVHIVILGGLAMKQARIWSSDESMLRHSLQLYPDNVPARSAFASLYASVGDLASEEAVLKQGQAYREHITYTLGLGSVEARKGNADTAQTYYTQAEAIDPTNPEVYFYQGVLAESEGGTEYAMTLYKKAVDLDVSYVAPMINLGAIAADAGDNETALEWYERALRWSAGSEQLQYNTALVLESMNRKDEAFTHFRDAYALNSRNTDIATTYAYRLYERGDISRARRVVSEYLAHDSENRTMRRLEELLSAQ